MDSRSIIFSTPLGAMEAVADDHGALTRLSFLDISPGHDREQAEALAEPFREIVRQVSEYFRGERRVFDIVLAPEGTEFQQRVWKALQGIAYGQTISYSELAERLGDSNAFRAVAGANALNPICILIPCHRVIGRRGDLTGYAYGLERKKALLRLEGASSNPLQGELFFQPNHRDQVEDE